MFALPESWVWDFWIADDGEQYHLFFLYASKALKDPDTRHYRASVGHAVSDDLVTWTRVVDALVRSDAPAFDELATWTGSVVRDENGLWRMFYTGTVLTDAGNVQSIGMATSPDLYEWTKSDRNPILTADTRWYERLSDGHWHDEAFRDPWVYRDERIDAWRMLITARSNHGRPDDRGVIATAVSRDLDHWELQPPLSQPGSGFGQLEVLNTAHIDGEHVLFFSCLAADLAEERRSTGTTGGVWAVLADAAGVWDPSTAQQVTGSDLYVGRVVEQRDSGRPLFLAFHNTNMDGEFVSGVSDPRPIAIHDGCIRLGEPIAEGVQPHALLS
ncbi:MULTISPECIES: glycosyl hydrolase family 32 [unclassified Leifsonia]|uniref:glycosyl hydrolase family 32 n=1 Tax=unclassified Leifsonia TaxID=2663824 RepID=UPI0008A7BAC5|nr:MULTISPECIES: glycosyl hydrolase family 32 [unclassified Leifsonia]SEH57029.1 beta-fructofuranosidase [Leifsonia sp. CL154]SFL21820.1 beta-fructofuranosidase [Leifsonia sp. CL147]